MNKLHEIEFVLRNKANGLYMLCDFSNPSDPKLKEAGELVDLADYIQQLNTFTSLNQFLVQLNKINTIPEAELQELYSKDIIISFNNSTIKIPFDAVSHNALVQALTTIMED